MRPVFWSFLAGLIAILAVSVLDYLLVPAGDTHLGPFIHVLLAVTYFLCLLLGTAVAKLCAVSLREVAARRVLPLCCSFLAILICNVGAFLVISRAILGYWVWEASIWWLAPSLVVGFVAASVFIYGYRIRTVQPCAAANPAGASQLQSTRPAGRIAELGSFDQKHGAVTLYLIDGKEAHGQDYVGTIDALPTDDLAYFRVRIPDKGTLMVSTYPGGFVVTDERLDGSSWTSPALAKDRVKDLVGLFLNGGDAWREGLEWQLTTLTRKDAWRRTVRIVLIGVIVIGLAIWLARLFTK